MPTDFYTTLGVSPGASQAEIKQAYRQLARQYHPDRNPGNDEAVERFKETAEAYRVLGDVELRAQYDRHRAGTSARRAAPDPSASDLLDELFGTRRQHPGAGSAARAARPSAGASRGAPSSTRDIPRQPPSAGPSSRPASSRSTGAGSGAYDVPRSSPQADGRPRSSGRARPAAERGADLRYTLTLQLEDSAFGCEREIEVPTRQRCSGCGGTGARRGSAPMICGTCSGTGSVSRPQGFFDVSAGCEACGGSGRLTPHDCIDCSGSGLQAVTRRMRVDVPAGVTTGTRLKVAGQGAVGANGGEPGDLFVAIEVQPHPLFERDGADLLVEVPISFSEAALGTELEIPTLDGPARMRVPAGSQTGRVFRLTGKGFPDGRGGRGDQRVRLLLDTPTALTPAQEEAFRELARAEAEAGASTRIADYHRALDRLYPGSTG
jgi:molecular chaperone DnaJ